ncbi:MAG: TIM barrel protein, partial [Armatimonadota bacterium]|nr:TIM barrel protein [Armatimonadota bacterium]
PFAANFQFHVARFAPVARILADHGCRLALEFIGPQTLRNGKRYGFIHTMDGMLALAAAIGENVGLLLDAWHLYTSHGTLAEMDLLTNDQVVYVHVNDAPAGVPVDEQKDNVRCLPGETGVIDLPGFLRKLAAIGYDGPVTPEPFSQKLREMSPEDAVRTTAEALRKAWHAAGLP